VHYWQGEWLDLVHFCMLRQAWQGVTEQLFGRHNAATEAEAE
jgi:hypothetical protein